MSHIYNLQMSLDPNGRRRNKVLVLKSLIKCFELVSGFKVNWAKSQLSTIGFSESESMSMAKFLGCSFKVWLAEYLGLPFGGSPRNGHF